MRQVRSFIQLLMTSVLLAGCSAFPGVHFKGTLPDNSAADSERAAQLSGYAITPITPKLLQEQDAAGPLHPVGEGSATLAGDIGLYNYKVGPRDILSIVVWGDVTQTSLFRPASGAAAPAIVPSAGAGASMSASPAAGFKVDADGNLYFPYVGLVAVAGKTTEEIRAMLTKRMEPYLRDPQITVDVVQFNSQKYQLVGAVMKPGLYPVTDTPLTVSQAISAAGGVINQVPNTITNGNTIPRELGDLSRVVYVHAGQARNLNLRALQQRGDASQDQLVRDGDVIQVPDNSQEQVHIIGEVPNAGNYPLNAGKLNLAQLLGDAGQINLTTANASRVFVFRGAFQKPQIYWLDMESPDALLLANKFELEPQDVVYVAPLMLTNWNRLIGQILPTVQTLYETKVLVNH